MQAIQAMLPSLQAETRKNDPAAADLGGSLGHGHPKVGVASEISPLFRSSWTSSPPAAAILGASSLSVASSSSSSAVAGANLPRPSTDRLTSPTRTPANPTTLADAQKAIITLEKRLAATLARSERLHKDVQVARQEADKLRGELVASNAYRAQLERELRELQAVHSETKKQLTTMEMRFLHESGKSGTLASAQTEVAKLRSQVRSLSISLDQERATSQRLMLRCEEQRAVIEVLQKSLNLKLGADGVGIGNDSTSGGTASAASGAADKVPKSEPQAALLNVAATVRVTELQHELRCTQAELENTRARYEEKLQEAEHKIEELQKEHTQRESSLISTHDTIIQRLRAEHDAALAVLRGEIEREVAGRQQDKETAAAEFAAERAKQEELKIQLSTAQDKLAEAQVREKLAAEKDAQLLEQLAREKELSQQREEEATRAMEHRESMWREREALWRSAVDAANAEIAQLTAKLHALGPHVEDAERLGLLLEQHENEIQRIAKSQAETQAAYLAKIARLQRDVKNVNAQRRKMAVRLEAATTAIDLLSKELALRAQSYDRNEKLLHGMLAYAEPHIVAYLYNAATSEDSSALVRSVSAKAEKAGFSKGAKSEDQHLTPGWSKLLELAQDALNQASLVLELRTLLEFQREASERFRKKVEATDAAMDTSLKEDPSSGQGNEDEEDYIPQSPEEADLLAQKAHLENEITVLQNALRRALNEQARMATSGTKQGSAPSTESAELQAVRELVRRLSEQLDAARAEVARAHSELEAARKDSSEHRNAVDAAHQRLNEEHRKNAELTAQVAQLKDELEMRDVQLKTMEASIDGEFQALVKQCQDKRDEVCKVLSKLQEREDNIRELEASLSEAKAREVDATAQVEVLESRLKECHRREVELRRQVVDLERLLEELSPSDSLVAEAKQLRQENRHLRMKLGLVTNPSAGPTRSQTRVKDIADDYDDDADIGFETRVRLTATPGKPSTTSGQLGPAVAHVTVQPSPPRKRPTSTRDPSTLAATARVAAVAAAAATTAAQQQNQLAGTEEAVGQVLVTPNRSRNRWNGVEPRSSTRDGVVRSLRLDEYTRPSETCVKVETSQSSTIPSPAPTSDFNERLLKIQQTFARLRATRM